MATPQNIDQRGFETLKATLEQAESQRTKEIHRLWNEVDKLLPQAGPQQPANKINTTSRQCLGVDFLWKEVDQLLPGSTAQTDPPACALCLDNMQPHEMAQEGRCCGAKLHKDCFGDLLHHTHHNPNYDVIVAAGGRDEFAWERVDVICPTCRGIYYQEKRTIEAIFACRQRYNKQCEQDLADDEELAHQIDAREAYLDNDQQDNVSPVEGDDAATPEFFDAVRELYTRTINDRPGLDAARQLQLLTAAFCARFKIVDGDAEVFEEYMENEDLVWREISRRLAPGLREGYLRMITDSANADTDAVLNETAGLNNNEQDAEDAIGRVVLDHA